MNTIAIDNTTAMDVVEVVEGFDAMDVVEVGDESCSTNMDVVENEDMVFVQEVTSYVNADSHDEEEEEERISLLLESDEEGVSILLESDEEEEEEQQEEVKYNIVDDDAQELKECLSSGYKITTMLGLDFVSILLSIYILLNVTNPYFIVAIVCLGVGVGLFKIAQVTNKLSDEIVRLREENANLLLFIQK